MNEFTYIHITGLRTDLKVRKQARNRLSALATVSNGFQGTDTNASRFNLHVRGAFALLAK